MKLFIVTLLFSVTAQAATKWCDIKDLKSGAVLSTYEGACDQHKFGGPWGDPLKTVHVANTTKAAIDAAQAQAEQAKDTARAARKAALVSACATHTTPILKAICDRLLND